MKKTIVFGSLLACFLMLMIPTVSAVEYQTVVDANESYFMQEIQNRNLEIDLLKDKLKDIDIKEVKQAIRNINIEELKEKILIEIKNSEITNQERLLVKQLLDSELLLTILIKGILIPVIILTISASLNLFPFWISFFTWAFLVLPVAKMVEEDTETPVMTTYWVLVTIDIILALSIESILTPSK